MKILPWLLSAVLLLLLGYVTFKCLDVSISLDHSRSEQQRQRERSAVTLELLRTAVIGKPVEVLDLSMESAKKRGTHVKKVGEDAIEIGQIVFTSADGVITGAEFID